MKGFPIASLGLVLDLFDAVLVELLKVRLWFALVSANLPQVLFMTRGSQSMLDIWVFQQFLGFDRVTKLINFFFHFELIQYLLFLRALSHLSHLGELILPLGPCHLGSRWSPLGEVDDLPALRHPHVLPLVADDQHPIHHVPLLLVLCVHVWAVQRVRRRRRNVIILRQREKLGRVLLRQIRDRPLHTTLQIQLETIVYHLLYLFSLVLESDLRIGMSRFVSLFLLLNDLDDSILTLEFLLVGDPLAHIIVYHVELEGIEEMLHRLLD